MGMNQKTTIMHFKTEATISSLDRTAYQKTLQFNVRQKLTGNIPSQTMDMERFTDIPSDCFLADPIFHVFADVDLLLSSEIFFDFMLSDKIVLNSGAITTFGWVAGGSV